MDRDRIERAADDELDRQERATTAHDATEASWETALERYQAGSSLMAPVLSVMVNVFAVEVNRRRQRRRFEWLQQLDRR